MTLKNKKILISAGPTWVKIDKVRILTNIASGETGILLAKKLVKSNKVTLLLGPVSSQKIEKNINLKRFCFFDDFKKIFIKELKTSNYDLVIHSAGVADFRPQKTYPYKIKSKKIWRPTLVPTEKLIQKIKDILPEAILVGFKLEASSNKIKLLKSAYRLMKESKANIVVANSLNKDKYLAYIVDKDKIKGPFLNKKALVENLIKRITESFEDSRISLKF